VFAKMQNRPFSHFLILQLVKADFRLPDDSVKVDFYLQKIGHLRFPAIKPEIAKLVSKNTPIWPLAGTGQKVNMP
jgi:hypothetical protein